MTSFRTVLPMISQTSYPATNGALGRNGVESARKELGPIAVVSKSFIEP